jgi:hypothetical protein
MERIHEQKKSTITTPMLSSMTLAAGSFARLMKLSKIKQRPRRLAAVGRICFATSFLFLFSDIRDSLSALITFGASDD